MHFCQELPKKTNQSIALLLPGVQVWINLGGEANVAFYWLLLQVIKPFPFATHPRWCPLS